MKLVQEMNYLSDIVSCDGANGKKTLRTKLTKQQEMSTTLSTTYMQYHQENINFQRKLMRFAMLLWGMLSNSESQINVTEADFTNVQKPDTFLQNELLYASGSRSKAFMCLELGFIPVKYVVMYKRMTFLHYIISESMDSMIRQVYNALKCESRRGNFYDQV